MIIDFIPMTQRLFYSHCRDLLVQFLFSKITLPKDSVSSSHLFKISQIMFCMLTKLSAAFKIISLPTIFTLLEQEIMPIAKSVLIFVHIFGQEHPVMV